MVSSDQQINVHTVDKALSIAMLCFEWIALFLTACKCLPMLRENKEYRGNNRSIHHELMKQGKPSI